MFSVHLLSEPLCPSTNGQRSATTVIVSVLVTDDEQAVRVPKTGEQEKRRAQAGRQSVCSGTTIGSQHSTLSQESPLTAVVPKPSEQRSSATMRTEAKRSTDLSD